MSVYVEPACMVRYVFSLWWSLQCLTRLRFAVSAAKQQSGNHRQLHNFAGKCCVPSRAPFPDFFHCRYICYVRGSGVGRLSRPGQADLWHVHITYTRLTRQTFNSVLNTSGVRRSVVWVNKTGWTVQPVQTRSDIFWMTAALPANIIDLTACTLCVFAMTD